MARFSKASKTFRACNLKPFLIYQYLKIERCIHQRLLVYWEPLFINSSVIISLDILLWLSGCGNVSGPSRNGYLLDHPSGSVVDLVYLETAKFTICGKLNRVPESRVAEKISKQDFLLMELINLSIRF